MTTWRISPRIENSSLSAGLKSLPILWEFQPVMKIKYIFQLGLNFECKNQNDSIKIKTIAPAAFLQSAMLLRLNLKLYGAILVFKVHQAKISIWWYIYQGKKQCGKQSFSSYTNRTEKRSSLWACFTERTDNWWEKMLTPDISSCCWRKKNMTLSAFKLLLCLN